MKPKEKGSRFALTRLVLAVIVVIQFVTITSASGVVYVLVRLGVISSPEEVVGSVRTIVSMLIICNIVGLAVAFLASRFLLKPIRAVIDRMNQLASGDFSARLHFPGLLGKHPTFTELSDSFNKMAEDLGNTEMLRSDFINNFSHEFKTPIVTIAGFAKLLKEGGLPPDEQAQYLDVIEKESMRLSNMATNVLELTRVENQTILSDVSRFNLSEQLRGCVLLLERKWDRKQLDFEMEFQEYTIHANKELLQQVWINLLDNAIKFSPAGGTIEISIKDQDNTISVSVINTGEPIPEEEQAKIFSKFYQSDISHAAEGNGIGLAIVKRVTHLHHGAVAVHCGNGRTTFTVTLPK